jgi:SAM-dependent methyltransferase
MKNQNWWQGLYDEWLAEFLLETRSEEDKDKSIQFLIEKLELKPNDRVLDQCCGTGTLSNHLSQKGYEVIGVDQATQYIIQATEEAKAKNLSAEFFEADAFSYICSPPCDAVFNWWTSFGYTMDDDYNKQMLQRAADSLSKGGRFLLDTMNIAGVIRNFKPVVVNKSKGVTLTRTTSIDWQQGAMNKKWVYTHPNGESKTHETSVKLYFPHTIIEMLKSCGFGDFEIFGNEEGEPLSENSMRCIILARKI